MLFPYINQCTFEDNDKAQTKLRSLSREADKISADFGGWLSVPRKRRSKPRLESEGDKVEKKAAPGDKLKLIAKNDQYYKRYRTDPLEGTFKHFINYGQYIKVYRETTTLCYKQKTLHELTSLYSATLDIGSNWQSYAMEVQERNRKNRGLSWQETQLPERKSNMVTSQSIGIAPLMLLPTAPSIPNARIAMDEKPLGIGQPAFMCNAYLNRNTVCPVHRLIHRRNVVISGDRNMRAANITPGMRLDHIKVELPGIPKRRYNVQIKRLRNNKDSPHTSSDETCSDRSCHAPPNSKGTTPSATPRPIDEDEDSMVGERINMLLSNTPISSSEKISNALSRNKKSSENLPNQGSMCLPITAILQYLPTHHISEVPSKIVRSKPLPPKKKFLSQRNLAVQVAPRKELKQLISIPPHCYLEEMDKVNYEKQYERYLAAVLESKGRAVQKRHYQNLSK